MNKKSYKAITKKAATYHMDFHVAIQVTREDRFEKVGEEFERKIKQLIQSFIVSDGRVSNFSISGKGELPTA